MAKSSEVMGLMMKLASQVGLMSAETARPTPLCYTILVLLAFIARGKILLYVRGTIFLLLSNEKKGMSKCKDSAKLQLQQSKTVIFIRHGESDWNFIFNKNKLLLLPRLVLGVFREAALFIFSNSVFIDSALSKEGVEQAKQLQKAIFAADQEGATAGNVREAIKVLKGDGGSSVMVSSNLRRAVGTGCIALWPRIKKNEERIIILSQLQEMSRNVDTNSLAGAKEEPETSLISKELGKGFQPRQCLDVSQSTGNKPLGSKALKRMESFCDWCFQREEQVIIVNAGHSLWFKNFFKVFLPKDNDHVAKNKKMVNCGVVAFNLERGIVDGKDTGYRVDPESVTTLFGGFEKEKAKATAETTLRCYHAKPTAKATTAAADREAAQTAKKATTEATATAKATNGTNGNKSGEKDVLEKPGIYVVTHDGAMVSADLSKNSAVVGKLTLGTNVEVVEVVNNQEDKRIRAKIKSPEGWISLSNTETGYRWAKSAKDSSQWCCSGR
jgi:hypothetical protein